MEKYSSAAWIIAFLGCFGAFLKTLPKLFEIWVKNGGLLRRDLIARITKLEGDIATERQECDRKLSRMGERLDAVTQILAKLASEGAIHPELSAELRKAFPVEDQFLDLISQIK